MTFQHTRIDGRTSTRNMDPMVPDLTGHELPPSNASQATNVTENHAEESSTFESHPQNIVRKLSDDASYNQSWLRSSPERDGVVLHELPLADSLPGQGCGLMEEVQDLHVGEYVLYTASGEITPKLTNRSSLTPSQKQWIRQQGNTASDAMPSAAEMRRIWHQGFYQGVLPPQTSFDNVKDVLSWFIKGRIKKDMKKSVRVLKIGKPVIKAESERLMFNTESLAVERRQQLCDERTMSDEYTDTPHRSKTMRNGKPLQLNPSSKIIKRSSNEQLCCRSPFNQGQKEWIRKQKAKLPKGTPNAAIIRKIMKSGVEANKLPADTKYEQLRSLLRWLDNLNEEEDLETACASRTAGRAVAGEVHQKLRYDCYSGECMVDSTGSTTDASLATQKWQRFLEMESKTHKQKQTRFFQNMRQMCPCQPTTREEIISRAESNNPFRTPYWRGQSIEKSIPPRVLSVGEVEIINSFWCNWINSHAMQQN